MAIVWGYRKRHELAVVALASVFTHPILTYLIYTLVYFDYYFGLPTILLLEVGVVAVEWFLLSGILGKTRRVFMLVLSMNVASYLFGGIFLDSWF